MTGRDLGGLILAPGVYSYAAASQLTGTVTLDAQGDPNAVFIFNVGSTLTTGTGAAVALINGAQGANVYFRVGSSATLGAGTVFAGKIFALASITLVTGTNITCGAALARNGAVTLDTNRISICPMTVSTTGTTVVTPPVTTTGPTVVAPATTPPPAAIAAAAAATPQAAMAAAAVAAAAATAGTPARTTATTSTGTTGTTAATPAAGALVAAAVAAAAIPTLVGTPSAATVPAIYAAALGTSASRNQLAVGGAIDRSAARGNIVPLTFQVMRGVLPARDLANAFTQISGEAATGVAPVGIQAMHSFLSVMFDSAFDDENEQPAEEIGNGNGPNLRGTVHALGYAEEDRATTTPFGSLDGARLAAAPPRSPWTMWAAGFGGQTTADGNLSTGSHDRSATTFGFAVGADYRITPDTKIGFALAGGDNTFSVADGLGGGRSDMAEAAVYSRTNFGAAYLLSALAYAWHDVSTSRDVTIGGVDTLKASFSAHDFAGQIEAGYRFGWFIPYVAIGVQAFHTPAYDERTAGALPSIFGLSASAETTLTARTQLGFRLSQDIAVFDTVSLRLRGRAAWAHDTDTSPDIDLAFQSLPGSIFSVHGAGRAANSLLVSAGPEFSFGNGLSVSALFNADVAPGYQGYYGVGQLRYVW